MNTRPNVGDRVRWTSQSNGVTSTKEGVVIYSGEPYRSWRYSLELPKELHTAYNSQIMFDTVSSGIIVRVYCGEKKTGEEIFRYYAPRLSNLEVIGVS